MQRTGRGAHALNRLRTPTRKMPGTCVGCPASLGQVSVRNQLTNMSVWWTEIEARGAFTIAPAAGEGATGASGVVSIVERICIGPAIDSRPRPANNSYGLVSFRRLASKI